MNFTDNLTELVQGLMITPISTAQNDHKADAPEEQKRVLSLGGTIEYRSGVCRCALHLPYSLYTHLFLHIQSITSSMYSTTNSVLAQY